MPSVPDRFLGFAFCVGDLLLELDREGTIAAIDGAAKGLLGDQSDALIGSDFFALLNDESGAIVRRSMDALTGQNRRGPFQVQLTVDGLPARSMSLFLNKLPVLEDRYFVVLVRPFRLAVDTLEDPDQAFVSDEVRQEQFFDRMVGLIAGTDDDALRVTVLDHGGKSLNQGVQTAIEGVLKAMSVDGASATRLEGDKFALVHEKALTLDEGAGLIEREVTHLTGVSMDAATLETGDVSLSEADGLKALIHGLKQFTNDQPGFGIKDMSENASALIGESTARVRSFRQMIDADSFQLVYQPIVNLKTGRVSHYEALSRFDLAGPTDSPFEAITFAEDVGLIDAYDMAVLRRVIAQQKAWLSQNQQVSLAVNVSGYSLSRTPFLIRLIKELEDARELAPILAIEVTESSTISDLKSLSGVLRTIRKLGFLVYLDDFGAGAAGFQYLRELKPDALKIDGSYIKDAATSKTDRAFLRSMVTLCRDLGIRTVGEWVENRELADLLTSMGVDYGQGYHFGRPSDQLMSVELS